MFASADERAPSRPGATPLLVLRPTARLLSRMLELVRRWWPLALIALGACWLRVHDLDRRPMHADEANQAVKLGELLDRGSYAFDPRDHHGPTLYYAAVPIAWLRGETSLAELTETTVRLVPAMAGIVAVVLLAFVAWPLGRWPAFLAAAFLALSPPAVYYSRYFIQETLLVTFTLAAVVCARRWHSTARLPWAAAAGAMVGLMQATKASAPLFVFAAVIAFFVARTAARSAASPPGPQRSWQPAVGVALGAALLTAALLYSSFGTNFAGLRDALGAYAHAFTRFGAAAEPTGHEKPWWYYLRLFGWFRERGLVWHQIAFSTLACAGLVLAVVRSTRFLRGVAAYAAVVVVVFSVFAYKTPWHAVHFVPGLAILAAAAVAAIAELRTGRLVAVAFALLTGMTLLQQTSRTSFLRPADQRNPYAYVHSSQDVLKFRPAADAARTQFPQLPIRVISEEYWPIPWYLRGLESVGYWSAPPDDVDGALIIASATQAEAVAARLRGNYTSSFVGLRPGFVCVLFTRTP